MTKTKMAYLEDWLYLANQSNLKSIQKALIGWKKAGLKKSHVCFDHVGLIEAYIMLFCGLFLPFFVFFYWSPPWKIFCRRPCKSPEANGNLRAKLLATRRPKRSLRCHLAKVT